MMFYIVSIKHTKKSDLYVTFWRAECNGYAWPLAWAGKYTGKEISEKQDYFNNGTYSIAVPVTVVDAMAQEKPAPRTIDGDTGPVVQNNKANLDRLRAARMPLFTAVGR